MQKILIDTFVVPAESRSAFLEGARQVQSFIRTLPGFVEGFLYEKTEGESRCNFLTVAVWQNEEVFENARKSVAAELQKRGFNPQERTRSLGIEAVRSIYKRFPY